MQSGRLPSGWLRLGRLDLRLRFVILLPGANECLPAFDALDLDERPAMILGMRELRLFRRIAIDFGTRRILFDLPSTSAEMAAALARFQS